MNSVRILIADDHELFRRGLAAEIRQVPGWDVAGEAANGRDALELAAALKPDIIVLDLTMPELNGLEAARRILSVDPTARILILTAHESEQLVREVLSAGAQGYVLKSDAGRILIAALQALLDGGSFFTSNVARIVLDGYRRSESRDVGEPDSLSAREREIVQLLAEGNSNKDIARALKISVKTAETHRSNIMRKMEFRSLPELVRYAIRNKIIDP
ncbi:MAG TPA: response regulator transcription factor [Steroidobacteraceae bacterium]|nr:response regulator transcription factor [Steroidobacteraceae bacterium]